MAPFFVMWLAFSFIYLFMPNTRVNPISASAGGIIGGTLWQFCQLAYIHYQFGFRTYGAIYGALSQLPMLLIWIFVSWIILLLGAEIAFAHQNLARFRLRQRWRAQPTVNRSYWGLQLLLLVCERFEAGKSPPTIMELAEELTVPADETRALLEIMENMGVLKAGGENGYEVLPAKDMKHLMVFDLVEGLEQRESVPETMVTEGYGKIISEVLKLVREQGKEGVDGLSVADLLARVREEFTAADGKTEDVEETEQLTDAV
jgi:membrane protein